MSDYSTFNNVPNPKSGELVSKRSTVRLAGVAIAALVAVVVVDTADAMPLRTARPTLAYGPRPYPSYPMNYRAGWPGRPYAPVAPAYRPAPYPSYSMNYRPRWSGQRLWRGTVPQQQMRTRAKWLGPALALAAQRGCRPGQCRPKDLIYQGRAGGSVRPANYVPSQMDMQRQDMQRSLDMLDMQRETGRQMQRQLQQMERGREVDLFNSQQFFGKSEQKIRQDAHSFRASEENRRPDLGRNEGFENLRGF